MILHVAASLDKLFETEVKGEPKTFPRRKEMAGQPTGDVPAIGPRRPNPSDRSIETGAMPCIEATAAQAAKKLSCERFNPRLK